MFRQSNLNDYWGGTYSSDFDLVRQPCKLSVDNLEIEGLREKPNGLYSIELYFGNDDKDNCLPFHVKSIIIIDGEITTLTERNTHFPVRLKLEKLKDAIGEKGDE